MVVANPNVSDIEWPELMSVERHLPRLHGFSTDEDKLQIQVPEIVQRRPEWPLGHRTGNVRQVPGLPLPISPFPNDYPNRGPAVSTGVLFHRVISRFERQK